MMEKAADIDNLYMQLFAHVHQMMFTMHRAACFLLHYDIPITAQMYCCSTINTMKKLNWSFVINIIYWISNFIENVIQYRLLEY